MAPRPGEDRTRETAEEKTRDTYTALTVGGVLSLLWLAGFVMASSAVRVLYRWHEAGWAVTLMSPGIYVAMWLDPFLTGHGQGSGNLWLLGFIAESVNFPAFSGLGYLALRAVAWLAGKSTRHDG